MNKERLKNAIVNYHAYILEISRIRNTLKDYEFKGVAASGIDSTLPKSQGISNPVAGEVIRREAKSKRLQRLEEELVFIQERIDLIENETLFIVLDCFLDGMTGGEIARHLSSNPSTVYRHLDKVVKIMLGGNEG
jgi:CheY-like chemotaxis protein